MASVTDFLVATVDERLPIYCDQLVQHCVLLRWLKEKGRLKFGCGGDGFTFRVRKGQSSLVRAISDWSAGEAKTATVAQKIEGDYAAYGAELMLSRLQLKRNEGADATGFVFNLFEESMNELMQDFENYLATDVAAGDGTAGSGDEATPAEGLVSIIDDNNTHYGIVRSTDTWYKAKTQAVSNNFLDDDDADGVVNGLASMRLLFLNTCLGSFQEKGVPKSVGSAKSKPDLVYSNLTSFNNFCLSMQPQQQYTNGAKNDPGADVAFFGVPYEWDGYAAADRIDMLNSKTFQAPVVGSQLIYRDNQHELGLEGSPRAKAIGLCSQFNLFNTRPSINGFASNTD